MLAPFTLFVFAFLALTSADNAWKPGKQYTYQIRGRTLTGIHQVRNQYSGVLIRAKLHVTADTENQLTLQVQGSEYADINRHLSEGWATEIPEDQLEYKPYPLRNAPFQLIMKNGVVDKMVVEKNLPSWEVNFMKAISSQFQVDTQAVNLKHSKLNNVPQGDQQNGVYKTSEDSVNGIYETLYEIYPMPEYVLQSRPELLPQPHLKENGQVYSIEKTRNFSSSDYHIIYRYGLNGHEGWNAGTNQMGNLLSRSSTSRIILTGNLKQYTIQYSDTIEKVIVAPHISNSQKGMAVSRLTVALESVTSSPGQSSAISQPRTIENLAYEFEQDEAHSGRLQHGDAGSMQSSSSADSYENGSSSESTDKSSSSFESHEYKKVDNNLMMKKMKIKWQPISAAEWVINKQHSSRSEEIRRDKETLSRRSSSYGSSSSSSSEDSSISSSEEHLSAPPKINESPAIEFLPDNMVSMPSQKSQLVEKIVNIAKKIGETVLEPNRILDENVLTSYSILSRLVSSADSQQLQHALEKLYYSDADVQGMKSGEGTNIYQNQQAWVVYRDALANAGTGPALVAIKSMIHSGKVKGEEAAALVATLPSAARYPTTEYMDYFFELATSDEVEHQQYLNTSAAVAFTELVRKSQVDRLTSQHRYPIHLSGADSNAHRSVVAEKYIPYFQNKLQNAVAEGDSIKTQVYIRALGNMAHRQVLAVYEPYLEGRHPISSFQRLIMVASLDELTKVYPNTVRSVLYRIYNNQAEVPEIRVAAVMQLMKTNPPAQLLQHMAEQTNYDHSKHVNAAVKSAIESAARGEYHGHPDMLQNARSAANLLNPENYEAKYCRNFISSFIEKEQNTMEHHHLSYIHGLEGEYPSSIIYYLQRKVGGYLKEPESLSVLTSSSQDVINLLMGQLNYGTKKSDSKNQGSDYTYQKVQEILKAEYDPQRQVEGNILISMFGTKRFFTFDNHTIEQLPKLALQLQQILQNGVNFHPTKYYNQDSVEVGFPMAMGLRFTYSYSAPSVQYLGLKGNGNVGGQSNPEGSAVPLGASFNGRIQYLQTNQRRAKIAFVFGQQRYVAGFERAAQIHLPVEGKIQYDGNQNSLEVSLQPFHDNDLLKVFQYRTNVYTTYHNVNDVKPYVEGSHVKQVHAESPMMYTKTYGKEQTGYAFQVNVQSEKTFHDLYSSAKELNYVPTDILTLMTHLDDSIANNNYTISYNPQQSTSQETVIKVSYKTQQGGEQTSTKGKMFWGRKDSSPKSRKSRSGSTNLGHPSALESRVEELLNNANSGIQDGNARVFDASISFGGKPNKGQYSITIGHSDSPVSEQSRYLVYYRGMPLEGSNKDANGLEAAVEINVKKPYVSVLNFEHALNAEPTSHIEGKISFGQGSNSKITLQGKMERSQQRKQYVQQHSLSTLCAQQMKQGNYLQYPCRNATLAAGYLDSYNVSINYQNVPPQFKRAAYWLYSQARNMAYQNNYENVVDVKNPGAVLSVGVRFSHDLKYLNVSVEAPTLSSQFENIRINEMVKPFLVQHPRYSQLQQISRQVFNRNPEGTCTLDAVNVTTFNNRSYPVNLGDCYHVVAMYAPPASRKSQHGQQYSEGSVHSHNAFVVLAKQTESHKKVVKVIVGSESVTLEPTGSNGVAVNYNGANVQLSEHNIARWEAGPHEVQAYVQPGTTNVALHFVNQSIQVVYDGYRAQIQIPNSYRNMVRGLCGTFDGEPVNDYTSPRNCIMRSYQHFIGSYAVADSTCQGEAKEVHEQAQNAPCYPKQVIFANVVSEYETGHGSEHGIKGVNSTRSTPNIRNQEGCSSHKLRIAEVGGKTCFSIKPQLTCNINCQPEGTVEKTIEFHCLNESSATRHWVTMVKKGANPDFTQKKSNYQMTIRLPEKCVPNNYRM